MDGFLGIGFWEVLLIFVIILALLGPRRLPEIAARIGTLFRRLKRASYDFTSELSKEVEGTPRDRDEKPFTSLDSVKQAASDLASSLTRKPEEADKGTGAGDPKWSAIDTTPAADVEERARGEHRGDQQGENKQAEM
jgi:Tat protein translocase TatB subunit